MRHLLVVFLFLIGCTTTVVQKSPEPLPKLSWNKPEWDQKLYTDVQANLELFSKAKDIESFCPKYHSLSEGEKVHAISELIVGMVRYESNFKPNTKFMEPAPLNYESIGLLQLSYEDKRGYPNCNLDRAKKNLEDPINNLDCGLKIMAKLLTRHGVLSSPDHKGLSAYWAVMRPIKKGQPRASFNGIKQRLLVNAPKCK